MNYGLAVKGTFCRLRDGTIFAKPHITELCIE